MFELDDVGLLDKVTPTQLKTAEEISQFEIDENLSGSERVLYLLQKGQEVQISNAISKLPEELCSGPQSITTAILRELTKLHEKCSDKIQIQACEVFVKLFKKEQQINSLLCENLLPIIIEGTHLRSSEMSSHWITCLLSIITLLPNDVIHSKILPIVWKKKELTQTVQSRIAACKLVCAVAPCLDRTSIIHNLMPTIKSLCQDIEYDVRSTMASNLAAIAACLDKDTNCNTLLHEIEDLAKDEEAVVSYAVLDTIAEIINYIDGESVTEKVMPLFKYYLDNTSLRQSTGLPQLSNVFGKMCYMLSNYCNDDTRNWYASFYRKLCTVGLSESARQRRRDSIIAIDINSPQDKEMLCRKHAAYNFPAMLEFVGANNFQTELQNSFHLLCNDPSSRVRRTISASFHEVCYLLKPHANIIQGELISLLYDNSLSVTETIIKNIGDILQSQMESHGIQNKSAPELVNAVIDSFNTILSGNNWRMKVQCIAELKSLHLCFPQEIVYKKFFAELYKTLLDHNCAPVNQELCSTLSFLFKNFRRMEYRADIINNFITDFCKSPYCYHRILYTELCKFVIRDFSSAFFKMHFFKPLITFADDPVIDVRLRFALMLSNLKSLLKLPTDEKLAHSLEVSIRKMLTFDRCVSVNATIRQAVFDCDSLEIAVEAVGYSIRNNESALLTEDEKKEEFEKQIEKTPRRGSIKVPPPISTSPTTKNNVVKSKPSMSPTKQKSPINTSTLTVHRLSPTVSTSSDHQRRNNSAETHDKQRRKVASAIKH